MKKFFAILIMLFFLSGCKSFTESDAYKVAIPVNIVGSYFSSVAIHEGSHALAGWAAGADSINVSVFPSRDRDGKIHLGYTTITYREGSFSSIEERFFNISGPMGNMAAHIFTRELLKSGYLPRQIQPTFQWISLMNMGGAYGEALFGLFRLQNKDLSKEPIWISAAFLGSIFVYDLYDILLADSADRYFKVLVGDDFYKPNDRRSTLKVVAQPQRGGGFLGLGLSF